MNFSRLLADINGIIENYSINMEQDLFLLKTKEVIYENKKF